MTSPLVPRVLGPLVALSLVLAGAPSATAAPVDVAPSARPPSDSTVRQSAAHGPAEQADVLAYWSRERMDAAVPLGRVVDGVVAGLPLLPLGPAARSRAAAPRSNSTGERWTHGGQVARTTGKVYLTIDGRDFTCSASVVRAKNRDTVFTAGHCLKDGTGSWARNWTFVPAYADGHQPYGRFTARELLVPSKWAKKADESFDFGAAVLNSAGGAHVQDRTGAQRVAFGRRPQQSYAFGYPSTPPYRGDHLHYCSGDTRADRGGTTANGMRCVMTQGSSGGPWLADFDPATGIGTLVSVISFKYVTDPSTQYGPRLGAEARRLYRRARTL
ncbi:serine protease [Nocardiopsis gilva YIM 90087]|uniref:Serine protease n=1 Tax=Nocardiopsis gilva YIM 90087 TaxID=1235441 RepID=A0A223SDG4_9ACTN|nr:trypsin-like serine protease [Nocardiopsis gilva]ASU86126.1 serine protease [Nocardiopsis gilva YIM 90087]